jgi:heterodisulfide reductase subunit A-like polyferredoxin
MIAPLEHKDEKVGAVMVIGGGVAGIQAALDLAESGQKVYLLESSPVIGGNMARLDKTFPTNDCAMCILSPKLVEAGRHLNIELITYADLVQVEGEAGHFTATVRRRPRYVDPEKCTGCGECGQVDVPDPERLIEFEGELWTERIAIDEVKCVQCGDCVRDCVKENPDTPAMSSIHHQQSQPAGGEEEEAPSGAAADLRRLRAAGAEERLAYWQHHMSKCLKCYGCRDICPVFIESECKLHEWAARGVLPPDAPLYHLVRAYYISQRCTNCGFCEDTCPGNLPLKTLVDLVRHEDPGELFAFVPGLSDEMMTRIRAAFPVRAREEKLEV